MKSLKTRLAAAFGAASIVLSIPVAASASDDLLSFSDLQTAILNVVGNTFDLKELGIFDESQIIVKDTADVSNVLQKIWIQNILSGPIGAGNLALLNDSLDEVNVFTSEGSQETLSNFLNGSLNGIVVAVDVLDNGNVVVWDCSHCKK